MSSANCYTPEICIYNSFDAVCVKMEFVFIVLYLILFLIIYLILPGIHMLVGWKLFVHEPLSCEDVLYFI